uniref:ATP synthase complex subunit 8 n=1 Tax=Mesembrina meridiana TaxID=116148 RepID=A0A7D7ACQ2_MESME|nr:ATP synthase F0 subunit 8 [Mesembrina meridiana]QLY89482.1 ATP synthase F0 subunit 8 [Mesembrina meridiana]UQS75919.1 ATP synthase F0 subunit 8 [Mesembrina meridiana]
MPQMAPIGWLSLFIIFSITFMIFNMMNYFIYSPILPKSNMSNKMYLIHSINWKW